ncbi:MAG: ABC transporter substrate-binding protein [Clostridia bacterium]|nr:ABC transporter substrate-binding protein [Clostridia bacterium]
MRTPTDIRRLLCLLLAIAAAGLFLTACSDGNGASTQPQPSAKPEPETVRYLVAIEDEPDTVDFQCTSIHYTVAQNVFNRLVEMENDDDGNARILPSLAERWEISADRRAYTFHLRDGVTFSNGSPMTASDVLYTFTRLLTHPDSCNQDIADIIVGAVALENGEAETLQGFEVLDRLTFKITLEHPFEAFLACLSMPGASILDEQTTEEAGNRFGRDPVWTIGTGSFVMDRWVPGKGMLLRANRYCWQGPPRCDGLDLRFMTDAEQIRRLFERNELDILSLDDVGKSAEYFMHGDIYDDRLFRVQRISITYIALNESVEPLNDVRVRRALQLALDRMLLLDAAYSGQGNLENGIMPHGLYGYNPDLPEIPYDPSEAKKLLTEAGYPDGMTITFSVSSASSLGEMDLVRAAAAMWEEAGIHTEIEVLDVGEFMRRRKGGELAVYSATWTADYNDPDNFLYTFFGNAENARFRSLCYPREDVMARVRAARAIADAEARIQAYRDLERVIVQEDAAWIPLFSRFFYYVSSERLEGIQASWNGSVKNKYREMTIREG